MYDLNKTDSSIQEFNITKMYIHSGFNIRRFYSDIALLKLDRPVEFTKYVRPACLYGSFKFPLGLEVSAVGWEAIDVSLRNRSSTMKKVYLDLFSREECSTVFDERWRLPSGILDKLMVCAGRRKVAKNICAGDTGGPLQFLNEDNIYKIVGISSFGITDCEAQGPSRIYTRVAPYISWIESVVWPCEDTITLPDDLNYYIEINGVPPNRPACSEVIEY